MADSWSFLRTGCNRDCYTCRIVHGACALSLWQAWPKGNIEASRLPHTEKLRKDEKTSWQRLITIVSRMTSLTDSNDYEWTRWCCRRRAPCRPRFRVHGKTATLCDVASSDISLSESVVLRSDPLSLFSLFSLLFYIFLCENIFNETSKWKLSKKSYGPSGKKWKSQICSRKTLRYFL